MSYQTLQQQREAFQRALRNQPEIKKRVPVQQHAQQREAVRGGSRATQEHRPVLDNQITKKQLYRDIYVVATYLKKIDRSQSAADIAQHTGVDIYSSQALYTALTHNEKILYENECFTYKPLYNIRNKEDLYRLVEQHRDIGGLDSKDIKDSYANVMDAAKELVKEHRLLTVQNPDSSSSILFYLDPEIHVQVDAEFRKMWDEIHLPDELEVELALVKWGLKHEAILNAEKAQKPQNTKQAKRPTKQKRLIRLTNTHLTNIDLTKDYVPTT